ncbi:hypothetical protein SAMN05216481_113122 [Streptomyces radiopugnans]|uniref:Beta-lactamase enzyme family protein n=2 Tax=Streptomyces radiopugnans TaxID=403935 RepID=A0A1H9IB85_9ACTN|nr:hypothetical protein SAMN05216481_113122 [Streptomyces radiopugnans]
MHAHPPTEPPPAPRRATRRRTAAPHRVRTPLAVLLLALGMLGTGLAAPASAARNGPGPQARIPAGVTAGVAVFDRGTGAFTERINADLRFRSASVMKLLIVLDLLWDRGPDALPDADRTRLTAMLRSSDDSAASHYWSTRGGGAIVNRMVSRLALTGTAPPPSTHPGYWGYTATTAADTVRIYRHVLDAAPVPVRDFVMGNLRQATRCASDGYDQYSGIASAFERPWAIKQGWSGFASGGCTADTPAAKASAASAASGSARELDLVSEALHSTGTVGGDDRAIVAVLTLHPDGTTYGTAYSRLTELVGSLDVPGARRPAGTWVGTWGSGVRVRTGPTTGSSVVTTLPAGVDVLVGCQKRGQTVSVPPYTNDWWAYLPQYGGYMTNIYADTPDNRIPGVPDCP